MNAWLSVSLRLAAIAPLVLYHAVAFIPIHEFGHCALGWADGSTACTVEYGTSIGDALGQGGDMATADSGRGDSEHSDHVILFPTQVAALFGTGAILAAWAAAPLRRKA